ncbi:hypothetical protein OG21DRAFT_535676 [Imleria badia]|nr:hypothetical protein OG21DRAFT_535676 [Imleria badia]
METSTLLSLSVLVAFLIHSALPGISGLIIRKRESITNKLLVWEESALEKNVNKYGKPTRSFIPNIFAKWPWPREINPNYAAVKKEADAWITSFQAFSPKAQDAFNRLNCSRCFPLHTSEYQCL